MSTAPKEKGEKKHDQQKEKEMAGAEPETSVGAGLPFQVPQVLSFSTAPPIVYADMQTLKKRSRRKEKTIDTPGLVIA